MRIEPPKIDEREFSQLFDLLKTLIPHYTPEWDSSDKDDPGVALLKIFSRMAENVNQRLNHVPLKNFVSFLDMLGIKRLPAQPAMVPVTFKLAKGTDKEIFVPEKTQAAADKTDKHDEIPFETEKNLLATTSSLKEIMSVDPFRDAIYVHTQDVVSGDGGVLEKQTAFTIFSGADRQEHSIYLGHKDLFNIKSKARIFLEITLPSGTEIGNQSLNLSWEYWGEDKEMKKDRWISFQVEEDTTDGLRQGGKISLFKTMEGEIKETKISDIFKSTQRIEIKDESIKDIKTRWIRCRLNSALADDLRSKLLTLDTIFIKTSPAEPIPPEAGFFNDVALDWTQVTIETKVVKCPETTPEILITAVADTHDLCVDSAEGFRQGDKVEFMKDNTLLGTGSISRISINTTSHRLIVTLDSPLTIAEIAEGSTICLTVKTDKVYPFGTQPKLYDGFAVGSREALSKKGAKLTLSFSLTLADTSSGLIPSPDPRLAWEYWNGTGWQALTILKDDSDRFLKEGDAEALEFICPDDIEETELNGQKNYWIRARIIGGDYGRDQYTLDKTNNVISVERKYSLPIIRDLKIGYSFEIRKELQYCLIYNNLDFQERTSESKTKGAVFQPFVPMEDGNVNFYLGFDKPLAGGPIRIFFAAREIPYTDEDKPKLEWNYRIGNEWALLDYFDETEGFIAQGHLELIGPSEFSELSLFGRSLYWLRGSLVRGVYESQPELQGIYPNTTWAIQAETIKDELLGSGNGEANQAFSFLRFPILDGEEIRVHEILSEEEKQDLIDQIGKNALYEVKDEKGKVIETWVLWSEVPDFFDSSEKSRHYALDRATGQLQFGDGVNGMIPPAGDNNIKVFAYQTGGGVQGNVLAGEIKTLKTAVSGVDKVSNPMAADGGADAATLDQMLDIGPAMISHRNRAVTIEDFVWLARQAARKVAKVRCLPNINREGKLEIGWVTVIIVPDDKTPEPKPSFELKKIVRQYLEARCTNTLSNIKHIHVDDPSYTEISVSVDIFVTSIDEASQVEREVIRKLDAFFHPLTGGQEGIGWEFGRDVSASDIYTLLEDIEGVDHVENLKFRDNGMTDKETVEIGQDFLVANGKHTINIQLKKELEA